MDGLTRYIDLLKRTAATVTELKYAVKIVRPLSEYEQLISMLGDSLKALPEADTELDEALGNIGKDALQRRLDNLKWRDLAALERQNLGKFLGAVKGNLDKYVFEGVLDETAAKRMLYGCSLAFTVKDGKAQGSLPKAIYTLVAKAQECGYTIKNGTWIYCVLVGYGVALKDDVSRPLLDTLFSADSKYMRFCRQDKLHISGKDYSFTKSLKVSLLYHVLEGQDYDVQQLIDMVRKAEFGGRSVFYAEFCKPKEHKRLEMFRLYDSFK